jgi:hypothetical protein
MKKATIAILIIILLLQLIGFQSITDQSSRYRSYVSPSIPDTNSVVMNESEKIIGSLSNIDTQDVSQDTLKANIGVSDNINIVKKSDKSLSIEDLYNSLINEDFEEFEHLMNKERKKVEVSDYISQNSLDNSVTLYFSSSEGNDKNDGLSPNKPKKSFWKYSGTSNINILLKCNDTFQMTNTFQLGENMNLTHYGKGERPILNYFHKLMVKWTREKGYSNVWKANLSKLSGVYDKSKSTSNCNIGILQIEGEYNWRRKNKSIGEVFNYPSYLASAADNSWAIDWESSTIYLYSKKDPNKISINYSSPCYGVAFNNISNAKIVGIEITGASKHGISIANSKNIVVSDCYIHHIGGACLNGHSTKYGNAIEIWDSAEDVLVEYNLAVWIYDSCYTNQGSGTDITQRNIIFRRNIGLFSYCGIESWGDYDTKDQTINVVYEDNLLMFACDITTPITGIYINSSSVEFNESGEIYVNNNTPYISYRKADYYYQQMTLLNAFNTGRSTSLAIKNNVFWGTKRFLSILIRSDNEARFPIIKNNVFYAEIPNESVRTFRNSLSGGIEKKYYIKYPIIGNKSYVTYSNKESEGTEIDKDLKNDLIKILNKIIS